MPEKMKRKMNTPRTTKILHALELTGLYVLAFSLPSMTAPKHFGFAFLAIGAIGKKLADPGRKLKLPDGFEWGLICLCFFASLSAMVNLPSFEGMHGVKDTCRYSMLAYIMYRMRPTNQEIRGWIWALSTGLVVASVWGVVDYVAGRRDFLELHGSGLVTHASIYVAIMIVVFLSVVLDNRSSFPRRDKLIMAGLFLITIPWLFLMGSRGTIAGLFVALLFISLVLFKNKKFRRIVMLSGTLTGIVIFICFFFFPTSPVSERMTHLVSTKFDFDTLSLSLYESDQIRFECWQLGVAQATQGDRKILGIGPGNYRTIDPDRFTFENPPVFIREKHIRPTHGHNMYITKWAEEGILGLIVLVAFQVYVLGRFWASRPREGMISWEWVAGAGAFIIPIVAGQFHSRFIYEFAWLSMMLTGYALGRANPPEPGDSGR